MREQKKTMTTIKREDNERKALECEEERSRYMKMCKVI
jgi:hypothetical protein